MTEIRLQTIILQFINGEWVKVGEFEKQVTLGSKR